ncbi:MAG TPA: hypothetical protein VGD81_19415 [Opitutaceae bacterium]
MSKVPTPLSRPTPRSHRKSSDAATEQHAALLKLVWENLDAAVKNVFSMSDATFESQRIEEEESYRQHADYAASDARKKAAEYDQPRAEALERLGKAVAAMGKKRIPAPDNALRTAIITERILEAPIEEQRASRTETVGFIDIACTVTCPSRLELEDHLPCRLHTIEPSRHEIHRATLFRRDPYDLRDIESQEVKAPTWKMRSKVVSLWIDVRTLETPVGQLLRELKTLREFAPMNHQILVVTESVDPAVRSMVNHEGFYIVSREWLEDLAGLEAPSSDR